MIAGGLTSGKIDDVKKGLCSGPDASTKATCEQAIDDTQVDGSDKDESIYIAVAAFCARDKKDKYTEDPAVCPAEVLNDLENGKEGDSRSFTPKAKRAAPITTTLDLSKVKTALGDSSIQSLDDAFRVARGDEKGGDEGEAAEVAAASTEFEYDTDGRLKEDLFAPKPKSEKPSPLTGSISLDAQPKPDEYGFVGDLHLNYNITNRPNLKVDAVADLWAWKWNNFQKAYVTSAALTKGFVPSGGMKDSFWSQIQGYLSFATPVGGSFGVDVPVNLIEGSTGNEASAEVEEKFLKRWDWDEDKKKVKDEPVVAPIYLEDVLRPHFGNATKATFNNEWGIVAAGAKTFETFLLSNALPNASEAATWAEMFKYKPTGMIKSLALWSGKTDKEIDGALTGAGFDMAAFKKNEEASRVENFKNLLTKAAGLRLSHKKLKVSDQEDPSTPTSPADFNNLTLRLRDDYAKTLAVKEKEVLEKTGKNIEELKAIASQAEIPYPFDVKDSNNPENPWAAQKRFNDFMAVLKAVLKQSSEDKAKMVFGLDAGGVERGHSDSGFGFKPNVSWDAADDLTISAWVFFGYAQFNPIDPNGAYWMKGGTTGSIGGEVDYKFYTSEVGFFRSANLDSSISYAGAGDDKTAPVFVKASIKPKTGVSLGKAGDQSLSADASFEFKVRYNTLNQNVRRHYIPDLILNIGDLLYVEGKYTYQYGGNSDVAHVVSRDNTASDQASGDTPAGNNVFTADVGQKCYLYEGFLGHRFDKEGHKLLALGASHYRCDDVTMIGDAESKGGHVNANQITLKVKYSF